MEPGFGASLASVINIFSPRATGKKTKNTPCGPTMWSPESLPSLWRCLPWCCEHVTFPFRKKNPPRNHGVLSTGSVQLWVPHTEGDGTIIKSFSIMLWEITIWKRKIIGKNIYQWSQKPMKSQGLPKNPGFLTQTQVFAVPKTNEQIRFFYSLIISSVRVI